MTINTRALTRLETIPDNAEVTFGVEGKSVLYKGALSDLKAALAVPDAYTETIVELTAAQILALGTSAVNILPGSGEGEYYDIDKIILEYTHVSDAYTVVPDQLLIEYNNNTFCYIDTTFLTIAGNATHIFRPSADQSGGGLNYYAPMSGFDNNTVSIKGFAFGTDPEGGDGTIRLKIYHKTITFGA